MSEKAPDVVRWYTRARKFPQLIGRTPDGAKTVGRPLHDHPGRRCRADAFRRPQHHGAMGDLRVRGQPPGPRRGNLRRGAGPGPHPGGLTQPAVGGRRRVQGGGFSSPRSSRAARRCGCDGRTASNTAWCCDLDTPPVGRDRTARDNRRRRGTDRAPGCCRSCSPAPRPTAAPSVARRSASPSLTPPRPPGRRATAGRDPRAGGRHPALTGVQSLLAGAGRLPRSEAR